ncbi:MAG TPA: hypothetical protein PKV98_15855 [Burkholderiaceae bacterium]|nr:hypothetical protein [Burkholderiaceae bacterium]
MNALWRNGWRLALTASEIPLTAPLVMHRRTLSLLTAPGLAAASTRREASRMVTEKLDAGMAAQIALWQTAGEWQRRLLGDLLAAASGRRSIRAASTRAARLGARTSQQMAQRLLTPVQQRVRANARRLRGTT